MKRIKEEKKYIILSLLGSLIPIFIGLLLYNKLPDTIAVHFNQYGEPDGYASKMKAILFPGLFLPLIDLFSIWMTVSDPKGVNVGKKVFHMILCIVPAVAIFCSLAIYGSALIPGMNMMKMICLLLGFLFLVIGNYLPKCRQNHTIGLRNPWTLSDSEIWDKTHRLGGYMMMAVGLTMIILAFISSKYRFALIMASVFIGTLVPNLYSYLLYRKSIVN